MTALKAVFLKELRGFIESPIALIVAIVFLIGAQSTTFYLGQFFEKEQARLDIFFAFHPWLYLFFMPAIAMRLWAEERQQGTIELLLTWPLPLVSVVLGKFFAAWAFAGLMLFLTFPIWISVNYLGSPDNGVILASYLASFLMAGAYLAICLATSSVTHNQVIAFVLGASLCSVFVILGWPIALDLFSTLPPVLLESLSAMSFLSHFDAILLGAINFSDIAFFFIHIFIWLAVSALLIDWQTGAVLENMLDGDNKAKRQK
jgi:ABC-2 type transport system permease protein